MFRGRMIGELVQKKDEKEVLMIVRENSIETAKKCIEHVIGTNYCGISKNHTCDWRSEEESQKRLTIELVSPCVGFKSCWALSLAKQILIDDDFDDNSMDVLLLKLRVLILWQCCLVEKQQSILNSALPLIEAIKQFENVNVNALLEMASLHFMFYQYDKANELILQAANVCKLNVDLTGMLGKRTRYQQKDVAQLVLVYKDKENVGKLMEPSSDIPTTCSLNDDTLLEQINVTEVSENQVDGRTLSEEQLACLLWIARHEKATHHGDPLVHERCTPFINAVIAARRCWPLQSAALLLRADLEKSNGRMVDRSCSQTELICNLMQGIGDETSEEVRQARIAHVLASGLEPSWQANVLHTGILRSLGCTSEALLILERLELWENVIDCYKSLRQLDKAESLIRRLLEKKPNDTMLYVYLGDITQNRDYYMKAIELSNDRNPRAHQSLGHMLLMQKNYEEAYKHLRRSLELQPIQLGTWFNAGYCAWKLENYKDATQCYHRCVSLQPDHFEAWNNLSASYIRYGQKEKAWNLLHEALKFNYEHANVWENFMLLSVDVGSFSQAIHAYHRLLDLNKKGADDEVLELIGQNIIDRSEEENDEQNEKDKSDMVKLLARITASHQTLSSGTLRVFAQLKKPKQLTEETRTEFEKYVQLLDKSYAAANGKQNWSKDEKLSISVMQIGILLANERIRLAQFINTPNSIKEASARVRLSLRSVITRIEKDTADRAIGEQQEKLEQLLQEVKSIVEQVS